MRGIPPRRSLHKCKLPSAASVLERTHFTSWASRDPAQACRAEMVAWSVGNMIRLCRRASWRLASALSRGCARKRRVSIRLGHYPDPSFLRERGVVEVGEVAVSLTSSSGSSTTWSPKRLEGLLRRARRRCATSSRWRSNANRPRSSARNCAAATIRQNSARGWSAGRPLSRRARRAARQAPRARSDTTAGAT